MDIARPEANGELLKTKMLYIQTTDCNRGSLHAWLWPLTSMLEANRSCQLCDIMRVLHNAYTANATNY